MTLLNLDGTRIFQSDSDRLNEQSVAEVVAEKWKCEINHFGALSPIDWYALRFGRMVGIAELKVRNFSTEQYPTVFLKVRKWLALQLGSVGLGVPALFVVRFTDQTMWIKLQSIDASNIRMGGPNKQRTAYDIAEPVIEVPVAQMVPL